MSIHEKEDPPAQPSGQEPDLDKLRVSDTIVDAVAGRVFFKLAPLLGIFLAILGWFGIQMAVRAEIASQVGEASRQVTQRYEEMSREMKLLSLSSASYSTDLFILHEQCQILAIEMDRILVGEKPGLSQAARLQAQDLKLMLSITSEGEAHRDHLRGLNLLSSELLPELGGIGIVFPLYGVQMTRGVSRVVQHPISDGSVRGMLTDIRYRVLHLAGMQGMLADRRRAVIGVGHTNPDEARIEEIILQDFMSTKFAKAYHERRQRIMKETAMEDSSRYESVKALYEANSW